MTRSVILRSKVTKDLRIPNKSVIPARFKRESMDPRLKHSGMTRILLGALGFLERKIGNQPSIPQAEVSAPHTKLAHGLVLLVILLFTFCVYAKSLSFPFVNWDDPVYVTRNPLIQELSFGNLKKMFTQSHHTLYIPLTLVSFAIDYHLYHQNPFGFHLTNTLLHLANTALVYVILYALTKEWLLSIAVALLFGIHPVQIESVVWVTERKNVLCAFFILAAFAFYGLGSFRERWKWKGGVAAFAFFVLACLSKAIAVVLPIIFVLFDLCFGDGKQRSIKKYIPFFLVSIIFSFVAKLFISREPDVNFFSGNFYLTSLVVSIIM